jgi:hypothetical protein
MLVLIFTSEGPRSPISVGASDGVRGCLRLFVSFLCLSGDTFILGIVVMIR